jgi:hypothetical protein
MERRGNEGGGLNKLLQPSPLLLLLLLALASVVVVVGMVIGFHSQMTPRECDGERVWWVREKRENCILKKRFNKNNY